MEQEREEMTMTVKKVLGTTCVWCVLVGAGLLTLLAVVWMALLATA